MNFIEYLLSNFKYSDVVEFYNVWCRESYSDDFFYNTYELLDKNTLKILREMGSDVKIKKYYMFDGYGNKIYMTEKQVIDEIKNYYNDDLTTSFNDGDVSMIVALNSIGESIECVKEELIG